MIVGFQVLEIHEDQAVALASRGNQLGQCDPYRR
jgi:hypothetical protein